jgi:hypothetical protein
MLLNLRAISITKATQQAHNTTTVYLVFSLQIEVGKRGVIYKTHKRQETKGRKKGHIHMLFVVIHVKINFQFFRLFDQKI